MTPRVLLPLLLTGLLVACSSPPETTPPQPATPADEPVPV
ncbi:lipoprotein, partial [Pseudomonas oryzihabitans]